MYRESARALGAARYAQGARETLEPTASSTVRLFDLFLAAAPEVLEAMPTMDACRREGRGARLFDAAGRCRADGLSCLTGTPATAAELELCDRLVAAPAGVGAGSIEPRAARIIVTAALLSAAFTCE